MSAPGRAWEDAVEAMLARAVEQGVLVSYARTLAPVSLRRGRRRGEARTGAADFTAELPGGQALVIECKAEAAARLKCGRIRPEQGRALEAARRAGALVLVAVRLREGHADEVGLLVHWGDLAVRWALARVAPDGPASWTAAELAALGVELGALVDVVGREAA